MAVATPVFYYSARDLNPNRSCRHVLPDSVQAPERDGVACSLVQHGRSSKLAKQVASQLKSSDLH
ncbi:hypothetical protein OUZ56_019980 [Daphnia magna]|uniref:Uncharacterized protein n=1 Tax=Daphnia magna TaxID=35525 RepID=A0ABQ9ZD77_9CRUS|nr:hypothetical protein OUZ56_019980 [Daphnia magna]